MLQAEKQAKKDSAQTSFNQDCDRNKARKPLGVSV